MATIRLIPSTYYLSNSSYLSVSSASNMYANTDSTNYGTVSNSRTSTTSYYIYLRGFNFDDIPSNVIINSYTVKLKASQSGGSTSTSYCPYLCNGTTTLSGCTSGVITTSVQTVTFGGDIDLDTIKGYGSNFGIRINCRRASRNTASSFNIYGAEIEVNYTVPASATVTSTLSGNGTIVPSGAYATYEGAEYTLTITPTDASETVTATKNGVDITSSLVAHGAGSTVEIAPASVTTTSVSSGANFAEYAVGNTAENPYAYGSSSNMYASSGSTGYAAYSFNFSSVPSGATIESVEVRCHGHRESSTIDSSHVSQCVLYSGSTAISEEVDFPSTNSSIITVVPNGTITRSELDNITLRYYVGYYGGLVDGMTFSVTYSTGSGVDHYTYTYTVDGNATIAVTIGGAVQTDKAYFKVNGTWTECSIYKKVNGSWVLQTNLSNVFEPNTNYKLQ